LVSDGGVRDSLAPRSPWYPIVTLHCQDAPAQWDGAIRKMIETVGAKR
jgi:hypothetical protein